jgi:hypothetical protein
MPLAKGVAYIENMQVVDIKSGVIQKPLKIDFHRTLIDPAACQSFTEAIVTDKEPSLRSGHAPQGQSRQDCRD